MKSVRYSFSALALALAAFLPASSAMVSAQYGGGLKYPLEPGHFIFAKWTDGFWYPAEFVRKDGERYYVRFMDSDKSELRAKSFLTPDRVTRGSRILIRGPNDATPATVKERFGNLLIVKPDNGPEKAISIEAIALPKSMRGGIHDGSNQKLKTQGVVLANICNKRAEGIEFAVATERLYISREKQSDFFTIGWYYLRPNDCNILKLSESWQIKTNWANAPKSRTYFFARTVKGSSGKGGMRWSGKAGSPKFCITDEIFATFEHSTDRYGAGMGAYCKGPSEKLVPFKSFEFASESGRNSPSPYTSEIVNLNF